MKNPAGQNSLRLIAACFLAALVLSPAWSQSDSSEGSLGDVARKTRADKTAKGHVAARKILDEETAPSAQWMKRTTNYWATVPPATITALIPAKYKAGGDCLEFPLDHGTVYVPVTEPHLPSTAGSVQEMITALLARTRFAGAVLKTGAVEDTTVSNHTAVLSHFKFESHGVPYDGLALFVDAPEQILPLGCIYRKADWEQAAPICEQMFASAEVSVPKNYRRLGRPR